MVDGMGIDTNFAPEKPNGVIVTQTIFMKPFQDISKIEV